jgi:acyl-coenzyme A thioesterase PaaI-like protein
MSEPASAPAAARRLATTPPPDVVPPTRAAGAPAPGERIGAHYARCFGCGPEHPTGLRMAVTAGDGVSVSARFTVADHHQGAPGLAHGGILSVAFDEAMGFLLRLLAQPAVTGRLEIDYLRPVPVGTTLVIAARCLGVAGRKIYTAGEGRLGTDSGAQAVRSTAVFVAVPLEHFAPYAAGAPDAWASSDVSYNP